MVTPPYGSSGIPSNPRRGGTEPAPYANTGSADLWADVGIGPYERTRGYGFPRRFAPRNDSTKAGSRSAGLSSPSFPARRSARNDSRHRSLQLSSPVPTSLVPESPVTPRRFPKEGPKPFLWSFQGGPGGKYEIPPDNLSWEARGDILLIRKVKHGMRSRAGSPPSLDIAECGSFGESWWKTGEDSRKSNKKLVTGYPRKQDS